MMVPKAILSVLAAVLLTVGLLAAASPDALALSREEIEARRAQRVAEREARRAERETERAARRAERDAQRNGSSVDSGDAGCSCRSSLRFSDPALQFKGGVLHFIPRVDLTIRTSGDRGGPGWVAGISYDGEAEYTSSDVSVPGPTAYSGQHDVVSGSCGDGFRLSGNQLASIPLHGITSGLIGLDQELDGVVRMRASVTGCGFDEEHRQFGFNLQSFGNLRLGNWRTVR